MNKIIKIILKQFDSTMDKNFLIELTFRQRSKIKEPLYCLNNFPQISVISKDLITSILLEVMLQKYSHSQTIGIIFSTRLNFF